MKAKYDSINWSKVDAAVKEQIDEIKKDTKDFTDKAAMETFKENFDLLMELVPEDAYKKEEKTETKKAKKETSKSEKTKKNIITMADGFQFEEVSEDYAKKNWKKQEIYRVDVDNDVEGLIEDESAFGKGNVFGIELNKKSKDTKSTKTSKAPKAQVAKPKYQVKGKSEDEISAEECLEAWRTRRASAKKSAKKAKTTPVFVRIADKIEGAIENAIKNTAADDIKKNPGKFIDRIESLADAGKKFLQQFRSILGSDYDGAEVKEFETEIDKLIEKLRKKYVKD